MFFYCPACVKVENLLLWGLYDFLNIFEKVSYAVGCNTVHVQVKEANDKCEL